MSDTITIAEVAAELKMRELECGDYVGPFRYGVLRLYASGPKRGNAVLTIIKHRARHEIIYTPAQVCELAGVDYERYEGREPEPAESVFAQFPGTLSDAELNTKSLEWYKGMAYGAQQGIEDGYRRGQEAGRAESAAVVAELFEATAQLLAAAREARDAIDGNYKEVGEMLDAAIAQAEALGKEEG